MFKVVIVSHTCKQSYDIYVGPCAFKQHESVALCSVLQGGSMKKIMRS